MVARRGSPEAGIKSQRVIDSVVLKVGVVEKVDVAFQCCSEAASVLDWVQRRVASLPSRVQCLQISSGTQVSIRNVFLRT